MRISTTTNSNIEAVKIPSTNLVETLHPKY